MKAFIKKHYKKILAAILACVLTVMTLGLYSKYHSKKTEA